MRARYLAIRHRTPHSSTQTRRHGSTGRIDRDQKRTSGAERANCRSHENRDSLFRPRSATPTSHWSHAMFGLRLHAGWERGGGDTIAAYSCVRLLSQQQTKRYWPPICFGCGAMESSKSRVAAGAAVASLASAIVENESGTMCGGVRRATVRERERVTHDQSSLAEAASVRRSLEAFHHTGGEVSSLSVFGYDRKAARNCH